jgi:hypothetical protein
LIIIKYSKNAPTVMDKINNFHGGDTPGPPFQRDAASNAAGEGASNAGKEGEGREGECRGGNGRGGERSLRRGGGIDKIHPPRKHL